MKKLVLVLTALFQLFTLEGFAEEEDPGLECFTGKLSKTYGGTDWIVNSCNDDETLVIVTAEGNPASPFYFIFYKKDGRYQLNGRGTGDKVYTQKAFDNLAKLAPEHIEKLLAETKTLEASKSKE